MADGFGAVLAVIGRGIEPDPELRIDEWAEDHMILPRKNAAEHGPYRNDRTPYARRPQECLSPGHFARRVIVRAASQMLKTQCGLNWIAGSIDLAPANMLVLMPTLSLAKRLSSRISETIKVVPRLRDKVAAPRSRDARNTIDTKEFDGGTLHITTAGSAANLAEIAVRYGWGDEVDRWELDVDGEGDPVMLLENRTSTYSSISKQYFTSSPGIAEFSRIDRLVVEGTDEYFHVPCPDCGEFHALEFDNLQADAGLTRAWMVCPHCGVEIEESAKTHMLLGGKWLATRAGDGVTISFTISALYAPLGWVSWRKLANERDKAQKALEAGDSELMQVFMNTRMARSWSAGTAASSVEDLVLRGEDYAELTLPDGALLPTVGVDVQHDRLAVSIWGWGRGEEAWLAYWGEIHGETKIAGEGAWLDLERFLFEGEGNALSQRRLKHANGALVPWRRCSLDTGDGSNQEAAYAFCRKHRTRGVLPVKGGTERGMARLEVFAPPKPSVDVDRKDKAYKFGLKPYIVGTHKAKDVLLRDRLCLSERTAEGALNTGRGAGRLHWYRDVRADFHEQLLSEVQVPSKTRRGVKEWHKKGGARNEALDTLVYAYHAARSLKFNLWGESVWLSLEQQLRQPDLLAQKAPDKSRGGEDSEAGADGEDDSPSAPATHPEAPTVLPAKRQQRKPKPPKGGFSVTRW